MNQRNNEYVVIIGSYTNACSIITGLKEIAYPHEILSIDPTVNKARCLVEIVHPDIPIIKRKVTELDEIVDIINEHIEFGIKKIILMTSEEFINPVQNAILNGRLNNTIAYTGSKMDNELIFDRFRFYRLIEQLGFTNVPKTISSDKNPFATFGNEFIVRVNKSWEGNCKLPRLQIVHSRKEKEEVENKYIKMGLTPNMWSYQEVLSTEDTHNVSVCGWYDEEFHQFVVTRKIMQHPPKTGNGDVVEIYHDAPKSLITQTETILNALQYTGAFEMEYVLDTRNDEYKIIELNPRFWMQHGLIEKVTNNILIKRAIGQSELEDQPMDQIDHYYWVNGTRAVYSLVKCNFVILKYIKKGICVPSINQAIRWGVFYKNYVDESNQ